MKMSRINLETINKTESAVQAFCKEYIEAEIKRKQEKIVQEQEEARKNKRKKVIF